MIYPEMPERGSGRTTKQLLETPDGAVFVVGMVRDRSYCMALLQHLGRDPYCVTVISIEQVLRGGLRGHRQIVVDHAAFDYVPRWMASEARELIEIRQNCC